MSRRRAATRRVVQPEPVYQSILLARFVNQIMERGKKSLAERIVYGALDSVKTKTKKPDALAIFERALNNIKPLVEVKSRRVGGATYQVPVEVQPNRATALAMRWLVEFAKKRSEKTMALRLAGEIVDAAGDEEGESKGGESRGKGGAIKKREDTHRMAEANKAFSHYRW